MNDEIVVINESDVQSSVPIVNVLMITYEHEKFIAEAIEGVVSQYGKFKLRLFIGEDSGKDKTRDICEEYARKYPEKITLLPSDKNYGIQENFIRVLKQCLDSDYFAVCEGDDKWVDSAKIKNQIEFLEAHQNYVAHAHNVIRRNLISGEDSFFGKEYSGRCDFDEVFNGWPFHAVSMMVRSEVLRPIPLDNLPYFISADRFLNRWIVCNGQFYYDGVKSMAVYHRHESGASQNSNLLDLRYQENNMLNFLKEYIPKKDISSFWRAKKHILQDIALFVARGYGKKKHNYYILLEYIYITRLTRINNFYFSCLMLFGRQFYDFHRHCKKLKSWGQSN